MNPFRFDVLAVTGLLALPVLGVGLSGQMTADQGIIRFLGCWAVATVGVNIMTSQLDAARAEQARIRAELDALIAASQDDDGTDDDGADREPRDPWAGEAQNSAGADSSAT